MLDKQEVISILTSFNSSTDTTEGKVKTRQSSLAHTSKQERLKRIRDDSDVAEQVICAVIEISRIWRGYICRKRFFEMKKNQVQSNESVQIRNLKLTNQEDKIDEDNLDHLSAASNLVTTKKPRSKHDSSIVIQRAWRRHIDMQVFRYYRDLINFRGQGDPALMLRCINPNEAKLLDAAAGVHVRFRLAGEKFPPNIYYKIYTHRPIIDMCANSPKDYTKAPVKRATAKQIHNKNVAVFTNDDEKNGWYRRHENNGWRLVSDRLIYTSMDPVTWETSRKNVEFHHVKLKRKVDVEQKRRRKKIDWMKKMYKEGMLKSRETDQDTKELVEKAARGLVNTVNVQGVDAVMDWEVDELLQWTTALNFDDYLEVWKESATSTVSELEAANINKSSRMRQVDPSGHAVAVNFDPYSLTRASSMGMRQSHPDGSRTQTESMQRMTESRLLESGGTRPQTEIKNSQTNGVRPE